MNIALIIFGISFIIGGIIGVIIGIRRREKATMNYYLTHLYPCIGSDGKTCFTPFGILLDKKAEDPSE